MKQWVILIYFPIYPWMKMLVSGNCDGYVYVCGYVYGYVYGNVYGYGQIHTYIYE